MKKSWIVFLLLLMNVGAGSSQMVLGGCGVTPMPINDDRFSLQSEHIVIMGHQLDTKNAEANWRYSCDYKFKNNSTQTAHCKMGLPFLVKERGLRVSIPAQYYVLPGDPLLYDFSMTINSQPVAVQEYLVSSPSSDSLEYKGAYLWNATFLPKESLQIHQDYTTGLSFSAPGQLLVNYGLRPGALWQGGVVRSVLIEIIPNTPTRLCHEIDPHYPAPLFKGKIIGVKRQRKYIWNLKDFRSAHDLSICLKTGRVYIHQFLVESLKTAHDNLKLNPMTMTQLRLLRNTVFAQYGRTFSDKKLQKYFDDQWWYEPDPRYSNHRLSIDDKNALNRIDQYEKIKNG